MDRRTAHRDWQELASKLKQRWDQLTDDDIARAEGDREHLVARVHEQYGLARDEIDKELQSLGVDSVDQQDMLKDRGATTQSAHVAGLDRPQQQGRRVPGRRYH